MSQKPQRESYLVRFNMVGARKKKRLSKADWKTEKAKRKEISLIDHVETSKRIQEKEATLQGKKRESRMEYKCNFCE